MKKSRKPDPLAERPNIDFSKGLRGKYTNLLAKGTNVVVLDPALLPYFPDSESVNRALHAILTIGNSIQSGRDDGNAGIWSPSYGIIYQGLENCVIRDNVLHDGAMKQLMLDLGGHATGVVVGDNPGRLFAPRT